MLKLFKIYFNNYIWQLITRDVYENFILFQYQTLNIFKFTVRNYLIFSAIDFLNIVRLVIALKNNTTH